MTTTEPTFSIRIVERQTARDRYEAIISHNGIRLDTVAARSMVVLMQHVRDIVIHAANNPQPKPQKKPKAPATPAVAANDDVYITKEDTDKISKTLDEPN